LGDTTIARCANKISFVINRVPNGFLQWEKKNK